MKTLKSILIATAATLFLVNCNNKPNQEADTDLKTEEHHSK